MLRHWSDKRIRRVVPVLKEKRPGIRIVTACCASLLLLVLPALVRADGVDLSHLPAHPRLFLRDSLVPTLRMEKALGQPKALMYAEIRRRADGYLDDPLSGSYLAIMNLALVGIVDNLPAYRTKAVNELMFQRRRVGWAWDSDVYTLAYDWLYNYMTPAQRDTVRSYIYNLFPPNVGGQRTVYYNLEANEAVYKGMAGLACYGDGGSGAMNQRFQDLVDNCDGRMRGVREFAWPNGTADSRGGVLPTREFYFADGGYYKGNHYGQKDLSSIVSYLYTFDDLGLGSYWGLCSSFLENTPEYYLRIRRPDGLSGRIMMGSNFDWDVRGQMSMAILSSKANPLATWIMNQFDFEIGSPNGYEWYLLFVLYRPSLPTEAPNELPLYKFYGNQGSGHEPGTSWHERILTRSGWSQIKDCNDVYFGLTAGDYFGDYYNFFEPTFEIYYRGALAIRSGWYTSGDADRNYYSNAVSCNSVVVFDSTLNRINDRWGEDFLYSNSWGGPGRPVDIFDVRDSQQKYGSADIADFEVLPPGEDGEPRYYARTKANAGTIYYYSNLTRKVRKLQREFFWTGRNFVVSDLVRIDHDAARPKKIRWLLHTIDQPQMNGRLQYSVVPGHIDLFSQGDYSAVRSGNGYAGKITVTPLLPDGAQLRRVGGDGYECWIDSDWTHGTNYPPSDPGWYTNQYEVGRWRVETIAPGAPDSVEFLHEINVSRPTQLHPPGMQKLEGEGMVGCEIDSVGVVVFSRAGENGLIRYSIQGENLLLPQFVLGVVPDMAYLIEEEGAPGRVLVSGHGGALCFQLEGGGGTVTVRPAPLAWRGAGRDR